MGLKKKIGIVSVMELKWKIENQQKTKVSPAHLPSQERVVVYLHYWKNLTPAEIGKFIDRTGRSTSSLKESALIRLKRFNKYEFNGKAA